MNSLLILLGILAVCGLIGAAFVAPRSRPPHFVDKDADGEPDMTETERREALRQADL